MNEPRRSVPVSLVDLVFPATANTAGSMFGGHVVALMDKAAYIAAVRYARVPFVTISMDEVQFLVPVRIGDIIEAEARVAYVGRTSLIVRVTVYRETAHRDDRTPCTSGWFAMASRDPDGTGVVLPPLSIETAEEREAHDAAAAYRSRSLAQKK